MLLVLEEAEEAALVLGAFRLLELLLLLLLLLLLCVGQEGASRRMGLLARRRGGATKQGGARSRLGFCRWLLGRCRCGRRRRFTPACPSMSGGPAARAAAQAAAAAAEAAWVTAAVEGPGGPGHEDPAHTSQSFWLACAVRV